MREAKQRRLAAKGWKTGDAKDFLGLSEQEEVYIDLRLRLAEGLKTRRIQQHLTQIQLAEAVQSSQSRIAKMESGDPTVSLDLLVKALLALGASARELAKIIASPAAAPTHR
jgi:DNA-binding XRE family transcriptional regulator